MLLLSLIALPITASAHTHSENHIRLNKKHKIIPMKINGKTPTVKLKRVTSITYPLG